MGLRKGCVFLPFKDLTYSSDFEVFFFLSFFLFAQRGYLKFLHWLWLMGYDIIVWWFTKVSNENVCCFLLISTKHMVTTDRRIKGCIIVLLLVNQECCILGSFSKMLSFHNVLLCSIVLYESVIVYILLITVGLFKCFLVFFYYLI